MVPDTPMAQVENPGKKDQIRALRREASPDKFGLETRPEKNLCHYTSQQSLIGILKERGIYATDARYLNDSQEIVYAVDLAKRYFEKRNSTRASGVLKSLNLIEELLVDRPIYVASFSERPDLLSQWRGYCPTGSGFALCISSDRVMALAKTHGWRLVKCIYSEPKQLEVLAKLEEFAFSGAWDKPSGIFALTLLLIAPALKHPAFEEESEWRALRFFGPDQILIRLGISTLVPYIMFALTVSTEPIELASLVVGPTPHGALAKMAVETLLRRMKVTCPEPVSSQIPFRNW